MHSETAKIDHKTGSAAALFVPVALAGAGVVFAVLLAQTLALTGGVFEYPLDDTYIHLALAEQIAAGGYGVNAGEMSSPGSSPLYPLLLAPLAGVEAGRFLPLAWNIAGLAAVSALWGLLLAEAGYGRAGWRSVGSAAALIGPAALMMPMVAFTGMEHSLHAAAALAVVLGLARNFSGRSGTTLVIAGAFLGAAFRPEGMALALLAGGALALSGARRAGLVTAIAGLLPWALFAGFLVSIGLEPLPSSVQTKLSLGAPVHQPLDMSRVEILLGTLTTNAGLALAAFALFTLALWLTPAPLRRSPWGLFALVIAGSIVAHLLFGQVGWLFRYEHYALVIGAAGVVTLVPRAAMGALDTPRMRLVPLVVLAIGLVAYQPQGFRMMAASAASIRYQQALTQELVKSHLQTPVAVNDLGWVAWRNPNYVLDLWGLASAEARKIRLNDPAPGWADALTEARDVPVAIVYDAWLAGGGGVDWRRIGTLSRSTKLAVLGEDTVSFWATGPEHVNDLRNALAVWESSLPAHVEFAWDAGMSPETRRRD